MAGDKIAASLTAPRYVTCPCQYCSGKIEFDASGFDDGETRTVECPHCHLETVVFEPRTPPTAEACNSANLPPPRAVPPIIPATVVQDYRAKLDSVRGKLRFADLLWAIGLAICGCSLLFGLSALDGGAFVWLLGLAVLGFAIGIPLVRYGRARANKLRRELAWLQQARPRGSCRSEAGVHHTALTGSRPKLTGSTGAPFGAKARSPAASPWGQRLALVMPFGRPRTGPIQRRLRRSF